MELNRVKFNLNREVMYGGTRYLLDSVILRKHKRTNMFYYQAELKDLKARSLLVCDLGKIEEIKS
ncbi:MAG: hypothetical protein IIU14_07885 [Ruminococcus sp.]|nr:hypothetical protein [Ruminococcus sp.]